MTNEERIKYNESLGYIHVSTQIDFEMYKKQNGAGGFTYYSDRMGGYEGQFPIYDDVIISKEELLIIAKDAYDLELK